MIGKEHPTLVAERNARIADHCEHVPPWWQFLKRRWWWRMLRALQAIDVSEWAWHLRQLYPVSTVQAMARHDHPMMRTFARQSVNASSWVSPVVYKSDDENGGQS